MFSSSRCRDGAPGREERESMAADARGELIRHHEPQLGYAPRKSTLESNSFCGSETLKAASLSQPPAAMHIPI